MEIINISSQKNYIVTHAIGEEYVERWRKYSCSNWKMYCEKNDIGLILIKNNIPSKNKKNVYWEKFLIPNYLSDKIEIENLCYLDTDVIINPFSENIFDKIEINKINLISQTNNIPYEDELNLRKKISYHRNKFLDHNYPMQSSIFMPYEKIYEHHGLEAFSDYACTGVFILNVKRYSKELLKWYDQVDEKIETIDNGEEVYLNYFFQKNCEINWLDYSWQALWLYEVANNYSFLYKEKFLNEKNIENCILNTLKNYNFLHFAGSWESKCWTVAHKIFNDRLLLKELEEYEIYRKMPIDYTPKKQYRPLKGSNKI